MAKYRVQNPATGEIIESFESATDAQVEQQLAAADSVYREWRERSVQERAAVVKRVAEIFAERREELAEIIALEMGKSIAESLDEVDFATDIIEYYAVYGPGLITDYEIPSTIPGKAVMEHLPVGVLLGVMPWNFPYYQVARFAAPNLVLGNTILLKHADICAKSNLAIQEIMEQAGVPVGGYQAVFTSHEQIATMIADPRVQGVSLTGSERAGAIIGAQAGTHLKKAVLELGGIDPMVVLDSDNVAEIAKTAWEFRTYNGGQVCNSNKRMIVMADIYDEFVAELKKLAEGLTPGDQLNLGEGEYAPLSTRAAAETVNAQVQRAIEEGATLEAGGVLSDGPGAYYSPAVLTGVPRDSESYQEEIFGPVATVYKVHSDEEALELANDCALGLGGSVFSTDEARAARVASKLEVGMAHVNIIAAEAAEIPFGGVKRSGFGREMGPVGIGEFANKRLYFVSA
ncbi:NAD-dependent succinate-semialdehyde dehydrogenase [Leucobacter aridicollis]|uniref:Succinate-semialdehyde dehydrogenase/glutarate-semialdehyde dehydrogenase n=1 Tax=Leucobacter aridicollis TaxID=283878 RepID=A0A852RGI3_9MICO|nr:NAD-dependent succinate-semialdehyde dehydrogenase [Leucobacter aridicollis]MBL3682396.1 NAD-dependent succinate-semialdehyde dehydrogenase [Leucobacter aridicollis]NYD25812.1 succinate-semialdehyde dehydrogenase/glutarate-semialdehyde dehydrogenase [Leucobacter aridicollis]